MNKPQQNSKAPSDPEREADGPSPVQAEAEGGRAPQETHNEEDPDKSDEANLDKGGSEKSSSDKSGLGESGLGESGLDKSGLDESRLDESGPDKPQSHENTPEKGVAGGDEDEPGESAEAQADVGFEDAGGTAASEVAAGEPAGESTDASPGEPVTALVEALRQGEGDDGDEGGERNEEAEGENGDGDAQAAPSPRELAKLVESLPGDRWDDLRGVEGWASPRVMALVESLLFVSNKPLRIRDVVALLEDVEVIEVQRAFKQLRQQRQDSGIVLSRVAGGYVWTTHPQHATWIQRFLQAKPVRLTRPQLETLAVVAYRQPLTRPEVELVRGVDCQTTLRALAERDLVTVVGRTDDPGRPLLYGTTVYFLEFFGISALSELPPLEDFTELSEGTQNMLRERMGPEEAELLSAQVMALGAKRGPVPLEAEPADCPARVSRPSPMQMELGADLGAKGETAAGAGDASASASDSASSSSSADPGDRAFADAATVLFERAGRFGSSLPPALVGVNELIPEPPATEVEVEDE